MTQDIPPAPPFRPLQKIVAKPPEVAPGEPEPLLVGHKVNVAIKQPNTPTFWRTYEVTVIDGEQCRLVTPNKKFHMIASTEKVRNLRNLQRSDELRRKS